MQISGEGLAGPTLRLSSDAREGAVVARLTRERCGLRHLVDDAGGLVVVARAGRSRQVRASAVRLAVAASHRSAGLGSDPHGTRWHGSLPDASARGSTGGQPVPRARCLHPRRLHRRGTIRVNVPPSSGYAAPWIPRSHAEDEPDELARDGEFSAPWALAADRAELVRTGVRQPATCRPRRHSPLVDFAERRADGCPLVSEQRTSTFPWRVTPAL